MGIKGDITSVGLEKIVSGKRDKTVVNSHQKGHGKAS
jgi:hypothetical protein